MEHDTHLPDDVDAGGAGAKLIALGIVAFLILGVAGWVVYGSGLWH
jgi:hypothetical protein